MWNDSQVKRGLWITILLGIVLGALWGAPRYGLFHLNTWNVIGLVVILLISGFAAVIGLWAFRADARDRS
jgi:hypothetical protein